MLIFFSHVTEPVGEQRRI